MTLGADAVDGAAPFVASGGAVMLLSAAGLILWRLVNAASKQQDVFVRRAWYRIEVLERENRICNRRQAMLIDHLRHEQIPIPVEIWTKPELDEPNVPIPEGLEL